MGQVGAVIICSVVARHREWTAVKHLSELSMSTVEPPQRSANTTVRPPETNQTDLWLRSVPYRSEIAEIQYAGEMGLPYCSGISHARKKNR